MKSLKYIYLIGIVALSTTFCEKEQGQNTQPVDSLVLDRLDSLTLGSLEKIDDYPLYVMTYYGDYGFGDYIQIEDWVSTIYKTQDKEIWGCTCFAALGIENMQVFGRNFDWHNNCIPLLLFTHPDNGYASVSVVNLEYFGYNRNNLPDLFENRANLLDTPWLPFDGMNEKGVAIGMMAVSHAEAPYDPGKTTINEIELIRLVLDYAENLSHAITLIQNYNIGIVDPPVHYLISDSSGNSAIIEFVEGEMIIIRNENPWQVSTNFIFSEFDDSVLANCWRFNTANTTLASTHGKATTESAMSVLQSVSHSKTIWSVVYNMDSEIIHITVNRSFNDIKSYNLEGKMD